MGLSLLSNQKKKKFCAKQNAKNNTRLLNKFIIIFYENYIPYPIHAANRKFILFIYILLVLLLVFVCYCLAHLLAKHYDNVSLFQPQTEVTQALIITGRHVYWSVANSCSMEISTELFRLWYIEIVDRLFWQLHYFAHCSIPGAPHSKPEHFNKHHFSKWLKLLTKSLNSFRAIFFVLSSASANFRIAFCFPNFN